MTQAFRGFVIGAAVALALNSTPAQAEDTTFTTAEEISNTQLDEQRGMWGSSHIGSRLYSGLSLGKSRVYGAKSRVKYRLHNAGWRLKNGLSRLRHH